MGSVLLRVVHRSLRGVLPFAVDSRELVVHYSPPSITVSAVASGMFFIYGWFAACSQKKS
jgi:hypothetical protein